MVKMVASALFSRSREGRAFRSWLGVFPRIALIVAPPVPPASATLEALQTQVLALRGDAR